MTRDKNIDRIIALLHENPQSINEITKKLKINWRTVESILETLKKRDLVIEKQSSRARKFFAKDKHNYFELPVKSKDEKILKTIYALIRTYSTPEPTKTQVYKITWKVNKQFNLKLPIGWYKYGPCPEVIYTGKEEGLIPLPTSQKNFIKETTTKYATIDNFTLQKHIYEEENYTLYLLKEKLRTYNGESKQELNELLMNLIKEVPKETIEVTTDFTGLTLLKGWDIDTQDCFRVFWKYIAMINHRESLRDYYPDIDFYMNEKIDEAKRDAQLLIKSLVTTHMDAKYSQDERYQLWKKKSQQRCVSPK
ncbi:MAG: winged helix-turn-helix domain-containing protein [Candidatus Paceibacterota bacterium]